MMDLDSAIELLEIADISKVTLENLKKVKKKAQARWHPDRIAHTNPSAEQERRHKENFQNIDEAIRIIEAYLKGEYHAGKKFTADYQQDNREPEDVIRENASAMQQTLRDLWEDIKSTRYKFEEKVVLIADGFSVKTLLMQDLKEDVPSLSIISLVFGVLALSIVGIFVASIPGLNVIFSIVVLVHVLACFLMFLPLSRFWLPEQVADICIKFVNAGMSVFRFLYDRIGHVWWGQLIVGLPSLFVQGVKYIVLYPLYFLAGEIFKDKHLGQVKEKIGYYAELAEWYANDLMRLNPQEMTRDELFHLSYMYGELKDVKSFVATNA